MKSINEIIATIDDELIKESKEYFTLSQANKVLAKNGIISDYERKTQALKEILEKGEIPHANKTNKKPRQWRIPLSEKGKKRREEHPDSEPNSATTCPNCGMELIIQEEVRFESNIQCPDCNKEFKNPFVGNKNSNKKKEIKSNNPKNWIIAISAILLLGYLTSDFDSNDSDPEAEKDKVYYINTNTYGATTVSAFDKMHQYADVNDRIALNKLLAIGTIIPLEKGTQVYLVGFGLDKREIRLRGEIQTLWVSTDHIQKNNP